MYIDPNVSTQQPCPSPQTLRKNSLRITSPKYEMQYVMRLELCVILRICFQATLNTHALYFGRLLRAEWKIPETYSLLPAEQESSVE